MKIVDRASTLGDRIRAEFPHNLQDAKLINTRLDKWCQIAAKGNRERFNKYLNWQGLDLDTVSQNLGTISLTNENTLPPWTETFKEVLQAANFPLDPSDTKILDPKKTQPFEEILVPFIKVARRKLRDRVSFSYKLLSEDAYIALEYSLLQRLADLCAPTLDLEFSIFRFSSRAFAFNNLTGQFSNNPPKEKYTEFVKHLLSGGLLSFFEEYSVLARLMSTAIDFWVDFISEFLMRLASDWTQIQTTFQSETELGQVVDFKFSLSDPHNKGRSVIGIKFESGLKLVYKPRGLGMDRAYFDFLSWINQQDIAFPFKLVRVIARSTYGWMEFVDTLPCQDRQEIQRYYYRVGMLLGILYLLRATDCHFENLINCGEQPVLIDLETLLHHRIWAVDADAEAHDRANQQMLDSVLGTHLLPQWQVTGEGQYYCFSPLKVTDEEEKSQQIWQWKHINSDLMSLVRETVWVKPHDKSNSNNDIDASPEDYAEEIIAGFRQMYDLFARRKKVLLAPNSPLTAFSGQKVRLVFRSTRVYFSILQKSLVPKLLREGIDRSIELTILARAFLNSDKKTSQWAMLEPEQKAIEQLDLPYFWAYSDSIALFSDDEKSIEGILGESSYKAVISRLQQLGDADLAEQISLIRGSLYSCQAREIERFCLPESSDLPIDTPIPLTQEAIVQKAIAIAQELENRAIVGANGSITWLGMSYIAHARRFQIQPMVCHSLYDGSCGVALFLAALAKVTRKCKFHDLALKALRPLQTMLHGLDAESEPRIVKEVGIGGATGLGAVVYTLSRIGRLLDDADLLGDARQAALLIKVELNADELRLDVMNSVAGAILGLLALYKVTAESAILMKAEALGRYLLECGSQTWFALDENSPAGSFLNGSNGIAHALGELYTATSDRAFLDGVKKAFERGTVLTSAVSNHLDLKLAERKNNLPRGAIAFSLSRFGILDPTELEMTLQAIEHERLQKIDNLGYGNFNRVETLLIASEQLARPQLIATARKLAACVINRAEQDRNFYLLPNLHKDVYNPGFFLGTTGIGYELLRLGYPDVLPSVLLWK
jgi:type 2 lantibiotic biosynthesis protein LanM